MNHRDKPIENRLEGTKHFVDAEFILRVLTTLASKGIVFLLGIAVAISVTRELGPHDRGIYGLAITLSALGAQFGNLGLHSSNTYYVAKNPKLLGPLVTNSLCIGVGGGCLVAGLLWTIFLIYPRVSPIAGLSLTLGLLGIPISLTYLLLQNLLLGIHRISVFNWTEILNRLVNLLLIVAVLISRHLAIGLALAANFSAIALSGLFCLVFLLRDSKLTPPSWELFRTTFHYAFRAYWLALFSFAVLRGDILMIKFMLGTEPTGQYSVAVNLADILCTAPITVASILFPKLSSMTDPDEKWRQTRNVAWLVGSLMGGLALVLSFYSSSLIRLLFGSAFAPAATALVWLMPGLVFISVTSILSMYVGSIEIPKASLAVFFSMAALNVILNSAFLPTIGIMGASIASSICYLGCLIGISTIAFNLKHRQSGPALTSQAAATAQASSK